MVCKLIITGVSNRCFSYYLGSAQVSHETRGGGVTDHIHEHPLKLLPFVQAYCFTPSLTTQAPSLPAPVICLQTNFTNGILITTLARHSDGQLRQIIFYRGQGGPIWGIDTDEGGLHGEDIEVRGAFGCSCSRAQ